MPQIPLELIHPNPFRDFELHPIDPAQVEKLCASIRADGFWTGVEARQHGGGYQLAFGHHRIEAARQLGWEKVPVEVRDLSDWQMVRRLATENATQRGTTAAASLDAIAAISKVVVRECLAHDLEGVVKIFTTLPRDAVESVWGKVRQGEAPGIRCIIDLMPKDAFSFGTVRTALGVLADADRKTFDVSCAKLFRLDSHLAEFRRIVTSEGVRSYLPVERQAGFAQQIIAAIGAGELTAIKLRERANVIFYEELGMPRHTMRNSPLRLSDDRVKDALNLMRRGTHDVKQCCRMLATLMAEGTDVSPEVIDRFKDYIAEIDQALKSLVPQQTAKRGSNLRLIVNRENVA
jgi:hypothetical protein